MKHGAFVLMVLAGCGGGEGRGPIPRGDYGREAAEIFCAQSYRCCNSGELGMLMSSGSFTDEQGCVDYYTDVFSADLDSVDYDGDAGAQCLDYAEGASCEEYFAGDTSDDDPACRQIFSGTLADDAPCTSDIQCVSGYCEFDAETTTQACRQRPGEGEACEFQCVEGFACIDSICSEPLANGELCQFDPDCASGFCDDSGECAAAPAMSPRCTGA